MPVSPLEEGTELHSYLNEGEQDFRFVITENAGSGSFENTYIATDTVFGDLCVIKEFAFGELCSRNTLTGTIEPYKSRNPQIDKKRLELLIKWQDRFELEALNLVTIYHTNIISVRLVWRERGTVFYAMNRVEGKELQSPEQEDWQPKSWAEVEPIAFKLLDALEAVHEVNLIHGDVKPSNILLTAKGEPILIDFGTTRNLAEFQATLSANTHAYTPSSHLTYGARNKKRASPELHGVEQTKNVTPSADLYSWAITIIGLLTRHPKTTSGEPLTALSRLQSLFIKNKDPYSDLASLLSDVPSNVVEVLQQCIQLDHTKRPSNVAETRSLFASKPIVFIQASSKDSAFRKKIEQLQKTLEEEQGKVNQAEKVLQKEKTRVKKIETENLGLQKALVEQKNKMEQTERALQKERIIAEQAEKKVQKERVRAEQAERELQKEKIRAEKAERELQEEKLRQEKISRKPIDVVLVEKPKVEKPKDVLMVDGGKNGFKTINEALQTAVDQATIRVMPGTYRESLVLNKNVTIIGIGKVKDIIIIGSDKSAISSTAKQARLQNLTLKQEGYENNPCIDISSGGIHIERCDISGKQDDCIAIHGAQSVPIVKNNQIHSAKNYGIFVYENGKGTIEKNDIFNNGLRGIVIKTGGAPIVRNNQIHENRGTGIYVYENGKGTIEKNDIFKNNIGISIKTGGAPTVRNNQIHENKRNEIHIYENGKGIIEKNDIFNNDIGIVIKTGGDPIVRNNQIHESKYSGIFVNENGKGTIEKNDIFNNSTGIYIKLGGAPVVRNNQIHENKYSGIYVNENGKGTIEKNNIFKNNNGISIRSGSDPTVCDNQIHENKESGIYVYKNGKSTIEKNDIFNNNNGIYVRSGGDPIVRNNQIHENKYSGIFVNENGKGTIEKNDIFNNKTGIFVTKNSAPIVRNNQIYGNKEN